MSLDCSFVASVVLSGSIVSSGSFVKSSKVSYPIAADTGNADRYCLDVRTSF